MTFLVREESNYDGHPILLYEFKRGALIVGYSSADQDIVANGRTYKSCPISDGGVKQKGTAVTDVFEITTSRDVVVADWFRYTPPSDTVYVIVRRFHWGDPEAVIVWLGQVVSVGEAADSKVTIKCQAVSVTLRRGGLRMSWQRGCVHALYDQNCMADKESYAFPTTITNVFDDRFVVADVPPSAAFWVGGIIKFPLEAGLVQEQRLIDQQNYNSIYPYGQLDGYTVGMAITLYPGCKRTSSWCKSYFNNLANYGGYPYMPNRSPYDGDPIF